MMILWVLMGLLSLAVCAVILRTLAKPARQDAPERAAYDLAVYKDQLAEIDHEQQRGLLDVDQAAAATTEVERRILAIANPACAGGDETVPALKSRGITPISILLAFIIPSGALVMYMAIGAPMAPNLPYASRDFVAEQNIAAENHQTTEMTNLAKNLAARLITEPNNVQGWVLLSRSYSALERFDDAVIAVKKAYELSPLDLEVVTQYAETLIIAANNTVHSDAKALLERTLARERRNPRARYYLALAKAQSQDLHGALQDWVDLAFLSASNAPWLPLVRQQIAAVSTELGLDPSSIPPSKTALTIGPAASPPAFRELSREDIEEAGRMSQKDQTEMIRGMVQRLADQLQEKPDDLVGWQRLARAYRVLGETKKAQKAKARVDALKP